MIYLLCGSAAFLLLGAADALRLRGRTAAKRATFASAALLMLAGLTGGALSAPRLVMPPALRVAGWALGAASLVLVILALVVELPTFRLYLGPAGEQGLVTTGLYAMARHPGVPCFAAFLVSLVLVTGSVTLAAATPVWVALDVAHVVWQERVYLLPVYGDDYRHYQRAVPMLFPTPATFRRGLATFRGAVEENP